MDGMLDQLSPEQLQGLREALLKKDADASKFNSFDLSKPPTPPYMHQEFPKMMYKGTDSVIVHDAKQEAIHAKKGWGKPVPSAVEHSEEQAEE